MRPVFQMGREAATANVRKHKLSFGEATTVFHDPLIASMIDPTHSDDEQRFVRDRPDLSQGRLLVVLYVEQESEDSDNQF